jgi:hypothetical protein
MPATLFIWPNSYGPAALSTPGHASLEIKHTGWKEYISWWPSGADKAKPFNARGAKSKTWDEDLYDEMSTVTRHNLQKNTYTARAGQVRMDVRVRNVKQTNVWVQEPLHRLELPGAGEGRPGVGLNLERIRDWWLVFRRAENKQYRFISTTENCAAVVGTALVAGGANLFAHSTLNDMSTGWHTPMDLLAYAKAVKWWINDLTRKVQRIQATKPTFGVDQLPLSTRRQMTPLDWQASMSKNNRGDSDLMTHEKWVELSDKNVKFAWFARRKEQVAKIDTLLEEYHRHDWEFGVPPDGNWNFKLGFVTRMLEQVHEHMREKADSDRAEAVFILGKQLVEVLDQYGDVF